MKADIRDAKAVLRSHVQEALNAMSPANRAAASAQAAEVLSRQIAWQNARSVLFYAPMAGELDVWPLIGEALRSDKKVSLPRFDPSTETYIACEVRDPEKDLEQGHFGIREPVARCSESALNRLDFILIPGVAFDLRGRRLGRGKGYYDQLLAAARGTTCGVAFDEQIVREVPVEPHDVPLNCILTPTRWIEV